MAQRFRTSSGVRWKNDGHDKSSRWIKIAHNTPIKKGSHGRPSNRMCRSRLDEKECDGLAIEGESVDSILSSIGLGSNRCPQTWMQSNCDTYFGSVVGNSAGINWCGLNFSLDALEKQRIVESALIEYSLRKLSGAISSTAEHHSVSTISAANSAVANLLRKNEFETADELLSILENMLSKECETGHFPGWARLDFVTRNNRACLLYRQVC